MPSSVALPSRPARRRSLGPVRRQQVESTVIASAGYDAATAVLELEFTSGDVYEYFAVPPSVHRALLEAPSAGRFFAAHIRDVYPTRQKR
jgi:KTSC domain